MFLKGHRVALMIHSAHVNHQHQPISLPVKAYRQLLIGRFLPPVGEELPVSRGWCLLRASVTIVPLARAHVYARTLVGGLRVIRLWPAAWIGLVRLARA